MKNKHFSRIPYLNFSEFSHFKCHLMKTFLRSDKDTVKKDVIDLKILSEKHNIDNKQSTFSRNKYLK